MRPYRGGERDLERERDSERERRDRDLEHESRERDLEHESHERARKARKGNVRGGEEEG